MHTFWDIGQKTEFINLVWQQIELKITLNTNLTFKTSRNTIRYFLTIEIERSYVIYGRGRSSSLYLLIKLAYFFNILGKITAFMDLGQHRIDSKMTLIWPLEIE